MEMLALILVSRKLNRRSCQDNLSRVRPHDVIQSDRNYRQVDTNSNEIKMT